MPVELHIDDGDPWWASPNVWTVPGDDPEGTPGDPIADQPCYLWARVRNAGSIGVRDAKVNFYWANPSVGFDRTTATHVGTSFVSVDSGETTDVLCLVPWVPSFVNEGHLCVLAEAFHESLDPLSGSPAFDVPSDRHVAQRNLSVVQVAEARQFFHFAFEVHNPARNPRRFTVHAEQAGFDSVENLQGLVGKRVELPDEEGDVDRLGFVRSACPDREAIDDVDRKLDVKLDGGARTGYSLVGRLDGPAALVHVRQEDARRDETIGGLTALLLRGDDR